MTETTTPPASFSFTTTDSLSPNQNPLKKPPPRNSPSEPLPEISTSPSSISAHHSAALPASNPNGATKSTTGTKCIRRKCPHGKRPDRCAECGGVGMCEHGIRKSYCGPCGGSAVCEHGKIAHGCPVCRKRCVHGKQTPSCPVCFPHLACIHGNLQYECTLCKSSPRFCIHKKEKRNCAECGGESLCVHRTKKVQCWRCGGTKTRYCPHGQIRFQCASCSGGGSSGQVKVLHTGRFCESCGLIEVRNLNLEGHRLCSYCNPKSKKRSVYD